MACFKYHDQPAVARGADGLRLRDHRHAVAQVFTGEKGIVDLRDIEQLSGGGRTQNHRFFENSPNMLTPPLMQQKREANHNQNKCSG